jgi:hypothetical protein
MALDSYERRLLGDGHTSARIHLGPDTQVDPIVADGGFGCL